MARRFLTFTRHVNTQCLFTRFCARRFFADYSIRCFQAQTVVPRSASIFVLNSTRKLTLTASTTIKRDTKQMKHGLPGGLPRMFSQSCFNRAWASVNHTNIHGCIIHMKPESEKTKGGVLMLGAALSFLFKKKEEKEDTIETTISKALLQEMRGNIDQADRLLHQALSMAQKDKNQQAITYIYDQMANMLLRQGKMEEAESAFKETLRRLISSGTDKTDPAVIEISMKLAQIYTATRRVTEAQAGFQWCIDSTEERIKMLEKSLSSSSSQENKPSSPQLETNVTKPPSSSSTAAATSAEADGPDMNDLKALLGMCLEAYARFFVRYKKYDDAIELFTRALAICEDDLMEDGKPHAEIVTILNDLGTVYDLKGDHNKAMESIRRSAQIAQRLGKDRLLPVIVCNLASVESHTGNYTEARRLYMKALKQAERQEDSRTVTIIKNKLAQLDTDILLNKKK